MQMEAPRPRVACSEVGRLPLPGSRPLAAADLGLLEYTRAARLQEALADERLAGTRPDTLLLLEHPPVITLGRRTPASDLLASRETLVRFGVDVQPTSRGGLATYHGPGQVVGYPIVHLRERRLSIPDYVCALQRAVIEALGAVGVQAHGDDEHVGVWTGHGKIAAIGVAQRHGVTMHGFAVNLQPNLAHFGLINACGIGALGVASAAAILGHAVDAGAFKARVAAALAGQLGLPGLEWVDQGSLGYNSH